MVDPVALAGSGRLAGCRAGIGGLEVSLRGRAAHVPKRAVIGRIMLRHLMRIVDVCGLGMRRTRV